MKQNAWIAGVGMTNFTKHADRTLKSLSIEAINEALKDADMTANQLEAAYMATAGTAVTARAATLAIARTLRWDH